VALPEGNQLMSAQNASVERQAEALEVGPDEKGVNVKKAITIKGTPDELYSFWRDFTNLPRFMSHVQEIKVLDDRRSHWKVNAPGGTSVEWDAEIVEDEPGRLIAWRSLEGADIRNAGWVRFAPARMERGENRQETVVFVELQYDPPLGKVGSVIAKFLGEEPEKQVYDELRAFKQVIEIGEVTLSDGSLFGPHLTPRPAQPVSDEELAKQQPRGVTP
jgi:uncharacterized membrane protein